MARRTKADALVTRCKLLDAAERLFQARGVSRTSLNDIAVEAGTTRGAIYWHFKDKADLFNAMMDRVRLPLEESAQRAGQANGGDAVGELRAELLQAMRLVVADERMQRVFDIAIYKVEMVDELSAVRQRRVRVHEESLARTVQQLDRVVASRGQPLPVPVAAAARGLQAIVVSLIESWLLEPQAFDLVEVGEQAIDVYLVGLGLLPRPSVARG